MTVTTLGTLPTGICLTTVLVALSITLRVLLVLRLTSRFPFGAQARPAAPVGALHSGQRHRDPGLDSVPSWLTENRCRSAVRAAYKYLPSGEYGRAPLEIMP